MVRALRRYVYIGLMVFAVVAGTGQPAAAHAGAVLTIHSDGAGAIWAADDGAGTLTYARPASTWPVECDGRDGDAGGGSMRRAGRRAPASNAHDGYLRS
jgi:hypothetical protein